MFVILICYYDSIFVIEPAFKHKILPSASWQFVRKHALPGMEDSGRQHHNISATSHDQQKSDILWDKYALYIYTLYVLHSFSHLHGICTAFNWFTTNYFTSGKTTHCLDPYPKELYTQVLLFAVLVLLSMYIYVFTLIAVHVSSLESLYNEYVHFLRNWHIDYFIIPRT